MGLLRFVANGFINFFGITQPSAAQERQAIWFICGLLLLILAGTAAVFGLVMMRFGR